MNAYSRRRVVTATWRTWCHRAVRGIRTRIVADYHAANAASARHAIEALVRHGWHLGPVPYGYRAIQVRGTTESGHRRIRVRLAVDPLTGPVVELIFHWRVHERLSDAAITRRLATHPQRRPPPTRYHDPTPTAWTVPAVRSILTNPVYTGRTVWGRTRHGRPLRPADWILSDPGAHPALIDDITFRRPRAARATQRDRSAA